jgi:hypothetical protein
MPSVEATYALAEGQHIQTHFSILRYLLLSGGDVIFSAMAPLPLAPPYVLTAPD